jgi:hypothetical protein
MHKILTSQGASLPGQSGMPALIAATGGGAGTEAGLGLLGRAGTVAVRAADLRCPAGPGLGRDGRTALTVAGPGQIRTGDVVVFCKPMAVAAAVVRRDGRVQAAGHPANHARLGLAEERLDELCGMAGAIDEIAGQSVLEGKVKGTARRAMTPALAIRLTLLMTLMPDADYAEVMAGLLGDLPLVPWQRPYRVPTATVACTWRKAVGPRPLQRLQDMLLAGIDGEHCQREYRAVIAGGLEVCSIDGSLIRLPDSDANREAFGSAGTSDDSSPFPQLRELRCSAASTRAALAVVTGPSGAGAGRDKGEAEQALLDKALKDFRQVFTPGRLWVMDRNFPGVPRIKAMLETGTHVLIRVRDGITLDRIGDFLPDGSYLAAISGGGVTLTVRVIEYYVRVAGRDAPELFCLITDLHDHHAHPAETLAAAYHWRWIGSETTLKEAKSAITGAGPSTGPILRSQSPALVAQEHAAWVISVELARATARAAAAAAAPARKGKRAGQQAQPREISFTGARRAIIAATRSGTATASLPGVLARASRDHMLAGLARRRVIIDRDRYRDRKTKARLSFPHAGPVCPPAPPPPTSASADRWPPDPEPRTAPTRGTGRVSRSDSGIPACLPTAVTLRGAIPRSPPLCPKPPITLNYMALPPCRHPGVRIPGDQPSCPCFSRVQRFCHRGLGHHPGRPPFVDAGPRHALQHPSHICDEPLQTRPPDAPGAMSPRPRCRRSSSLATCAEARRDHPSG